MTETIGNVQISDHDIHYGYEGGFYVNFIIKTKEPISEEKATEILYNHFNKKPIDQLKNEWKPFMPVGFNLDLTFGKHCDYASKTQIILN